MQFPIVKDSEPDLDRFLKSDWRVPESEAEEGSRVSKYRDVETQSKQMIGFSIIDQKSWLAVQHLCLKLNLGGA